MLGLTFRGYLGRDAETRTVGQTSVVEFTVGCKSSKKDENQKPKTEWVSVKVWGKLGQYVANLKKGDSFAAYGNEYIDEYTGRDGQTRYVRCVDVRDIIYMPSSKESGNADVAPAPTQTRKAEPIDDGDGLPF